MKLHTLKPAEGSIKSRKRIGRGQGSGRGGTSTRGHKGAKSRSGYKSKLGFEGGQMPLQRRVPKFGFKSLNRVEYKPINLNVLEELAKSESLDTITLETLISHGLVSKKDVVKVLGRGELTAKLNVSAHSFSASAIEAIEKVGGTVNKL
ncbi:LSU ribosomal protein L15p (L27Ae) [Indibacter alkaliphilus LW1]|jgi:large subunit ribosomal protein L15|uniref:Large ribosomal subunit protein uL15 n=1 Tax=Indibacter alkaliphilus (strain CCUG 57479 / KCTC 22604 / LW1) TaxID=1189612 RepID=S2DR73_INDAL|nr:50S ribosomal protein L15 [Indibacter alkaliphilus]EOZ99780.1 LSU ribosomal protein L15p (L27Ae) [Indibacter alkaliphilus LW1]